MKNFEKLFRYFFTFVWTLFVIFQQIVLFIKNPSEYFNSPTSINFPSIINDKKYGRSSITKVKTTKGENDEKCEMEIHSMISGESNSKTIIMIHGFPEFWFSYRYQIEHFNKFYRVIALDLRGYNLSSKPKCIADYRINHLANDIKGLMDALNINKAILLAHDWGGAVAWKFDQMYPEKVEKLITLNIPEPKAFMTTLQSSMKQFLKSWYIMFFQSPYIPEWTLSRFDLDFVEKAFSSSKMGMQKTKLSSEEMIAFKANMAYKDTMRCGINYYRAAIRYPMNRDVTRSNEPNRYLLIFGDKDGAIETEAARLSAKFLSNLKLEILSGISHWVQQDDPITVNRLIEDFLA